MTTSNPIHPGVLNNVVAPCALPMQPAAGRLFSSIDTRHGRLSSADRERDSLRPDHVVTSDHNRQGLSDLIEEGVIYRRHGVGTFVSRPHVIRDHNGLTNFFESATEKGIAASMHVLIADILPARLKVANALTLLEGELALHIKTLRYANGIPVTLHDAYVPYKLFHQLLQEDLESRHLWDFMEAYGYPVKRAVQKLEAREADEELAQLLEVEVGSPILYKERTVYIADGTPVEFTHCYNRGDCYSLTVTLNR
ncbi:MAG: GntR family transcriptional regulator [Pirellulaceae bacterium]|nr:GntR family transcriptional regulator [Pirellulaceae bacterium]